MPEDRVQYDLTSLREIVAAELRLDPARLNLRAGSGARGRRRGAATLRWVAEVDGEPRYSIKLYPEGFRRPVDEIIEVAERLSRELGIRTPRFVAKIRAPGLVGIVEEFVGGAPTLQQLRDSGAMGEEAVLAVLRSFFEKFMSRTFPAGEVRERDRSRCLHALRWHGEGTELHRDLARLVAECEALFTTEACLVHEDLVASNVLMPPGGDPILVDFDSCCLTTMPWYAAWRAAHVAGLPRFFWLPEWRRAGERNLFNLCSALETELQFTVLDPERFALDRDRGWRGLVDELQGKLDASQRELRRLSECRRPGEGPAGDGAGGPPFQGPLPQVSIIVVNHNGLRHIDPLFAALAGQTYPNREVVFVDNASSDGSAEHVASRYPSALLVRSGANLGFSGGNNLGVSRASGSLVAFLNNDTQPEPGWLSALVESIQESPDVGAVGSKILFLAPYLRLDFSIRAHVPSSSGKSEDSRELGAAFDVTSGFIGCVDARPLFLDGFYGTETWEDRVVRWAKPKAAACLPLPPCRPARLRLMVCGCGHEEARTLYVAVGGVPFIAIKLEANLQAVETEVPDELLEKATDVVNNAGSFLDSEGNTGDRGIFMPDDGSFDTPEEVTSLCGCSMMVRRDLFLSLGGFDESFFMYFEDSDLSWRIRRAGFRLAYQPRSVVRHVHGASSGEGSPLFTYYVTRNGPLMKLKNLPFGRAAAAYRELLGRVRRARMACPGVLPRISPEILGSLNGPQIERAAVTQAARRGLAILVRRLLRAGRPL